jgi:hypothetical protein
MLLSFVVSPPATEQWKGIPGRKFCGYACPNNYGTQSTGAHDVVCILFMKRV